MLYVEKYRGEPAGDLAVPCLLFERQPPRGRIDTTWRSRMTDTSTKRKEGQSSALMTLIRAIASRDQQEASRLLEASPALARQGAEIGATRQVSTDYYFKEIEHYVYGGDTALHIAAAAYALEISKKLLAGGAHVRARNRRGAEPLHYA